MQGLVAYSGAQCCVFVELARLRFADAPQAGLRFQRGQNVPTKPGQCIEYKAGVLPAQYSRKPDWRCCVFVSTEDGIVTEELDPSTTKETAIPTIEVAVPEGPTVPVKFILQKKCEFGQNFKVVGNQSLFGCWNPEAALPMTWADGHIWSVEVDVPVGKQIEFKFVLTGENGDIEWQPGPNHLFETVEDGSALILDSKWGSEDEQELAESPEEVETTTEETAPITTEELSNVADVGGLVEAAKEEIAADLPSMAGLIGEAKEKVTSEIDSKLEEVNGSPLLSNFSSEESSETGPDVQLANATPVPGIVQTAAE